MGVLDTINKKQKPKPIQGDIKILYANNGFIVSPDGPMLAPDKSLTYPPNVWVFKSKEELAEFIKNYFVAPEDRFEDEQP